MNIWNIAGGISMTGGSIQSNNGASDRNSSQLEWNRTRVTTHASADTAMIAGLIRMRPDDRFTGQGSPFKSREFNTFISQWLATHFMTIPFYAPSQGKFERFHQTFKDQVISPLTTLDLADAKRFLGKFIGYCNNTRLPSSIGLMPPKTEWKGD
ncbi:MAG: hypothetical protein RL117_1399 [Verrucomicrobiota bacterium]|jgi:transposase InsO family protein